MKRSLLAHGWEVEYLGDYSGDAVFNAIDGSVVRIECTSINDLLGKLSQKVKTDVPKLGITKGMQRLEAQMRGIREQSDHPLLLLQVPRLQATPDGQIITDGKGYTPRSLQSLLHIFISLQYNGIKMVWLPMKGDVELTKAVLGIYEWYQKPVHSWYNKPTVFFPYHPKLAFLMGIDGVGEVMARRILTALEVEETKSETLVPLVVDLKDITKAMSSLIQQGNRRTLLDAVSPSLPQDNKGKVSFSHTVYEQSEETKELIDKLYGKEAE